MVVEMAFLQLLIVSRQDAAINIIRPLHTTKRTAFVLLQWGSYRTGATGDLDMSTGKILGLEAISEAVMDAVDTGGNMGMEVRRPFKIFGRMELLGQERRYQCRILIVDGKVVKRMRILFLITVCRVFFSFEGERRKNTT